MKISVILGHPYKESFNNAIAETVVKTLQQNNHEVFYHDLYQEKFDPVMTGYELINKVSEDKLVEKHCQEIVEADGIIIVHPNWWGQPPAILTGWVDRVLRMETAYIYRNDGSGLPIGLLKAKAAIVFNTSNTIEEREEKVFGDPLETLWKNCIFDFCGVKEFKRNIFRIIAISSPEQRKKWLTEVQETVNQYFPAEE